MRIAGGTMLGTRGRLRTTGVALIATLALIAGAAPASADVPPPARVKSNYETATGNALHRDCGYSAPLPDSPGMSLWLFCDTTIELAGGGTALSLGTHAAIGPSSPGMVPTTLSEIPTPPTPIGELPSSRGVARFLPNPTGLVKANGQPCGAQLAWATGIETGPSGSMTIQTPSGPLTLPDASKHLFITYIDVCTSGLLDIQVKAFGIAIYRPLDNTIIANHKVFVAPPSTGTLAEPLLYSPQIDGGSLSLFSAHCDEISWVFTACLGGQIQVSSVPVSSMFSPGAYSFTPPGQSIVQLPNGASLGPFAVTVADHRSEGRGYLLMEQMAMGGQYRLWQAASPAGPWTYRQTGMLSGSCTTGSGGGCYAIVGHPQLTSGNQLMFGAYDAGPPEHNFIKLSTITVSF